VHTLFAGPVRGYELPEDPGKDAGLPGGATGRAGAGVVGGTFGTLGRIGGQGRDRTADTAIFSRMLYQLSYLATVCARWAGTEKRL